MEGGYGQAGWKASMGDAMAATVMGGSRLGQGWEEREPARLAGRRAHMCFLTWTRVPVRPIRALCEETDTELPVLLLGSDPSDAF